MPKQTTAVILDIVKGIRRLDPNQSYPISLEQISREKNVLDWTLASYKNNHINNILYCGSYHIEKVIRKYHDIQYYFAPGKTEPHECNILTELDSKIKDNFFINYANVLFHSNIVKKFIKKDSDIVIGIDSNPDSEYSPDWSFNFPNNIGRFTGIIYLKKRCQKYFFNTVNKIIASRKHNTLKNVLQEILKKKKKSVNISFIDVSGQYSYIRDKQSLSKFVLGTKAQTLERLRKLVTKSTILKQISFTVKDWETNQKKISDKIQDKFTGQHLVIRSSALCEDSFENSMAGHFESILDINADNKTSVTEAVETVIKSFISGKAENSGNQIFIQPFLKKINMSGVIFTRDLNTGAPYYVINYDKKSTFGVTSGQGEELDTIIVYKYSDKKIANKKIHLLLQAVKEIEELIAMDELDIEFAVCGNKIYIFQVRPLSGYKNRFTLTDEDVRNEINNIYSFIKNLNCKNPHISGNKAVLSVMSDWNPAEMIGTRPKPLALSLYKYLITNETWAISRKEGGYKDVRPEPLMTNIAGHPYINTKVSINSFMPADIPKSVADKVLKTLSKKLTKQPHLHDKLEFEIALTSMVPDTEYYKKRLKDMALTSLETKKYINSLFKLTDNIISGKTAPIKKQNKRLKELDERQKNILTISGENPNILINKIFHLLNDCRKFGVLPFSNLARYAFISMQFIKYFYKAGVFSKNEVDHLLVAIPTVASEISVNINKVLKGKLALKKFLEKYGHLRPGTYDITSKSYSRAPDLYLKKGSANNPGSLKHKTSKEFDSIFFSKQKEISKILKKNKFSFSVDTLRDFIIQSIAGREYAKFKFSKNISLSLELLAELGSHFNFTREDMSYITIDRILELYSTSMAGDIKTVFKRSISHEKKRYALSQAILLPDVLTGTQDLHYFKLSQEAPNFITHKTITADVLHLTSEVKAETLKGKIILIEKADPGYDWLFVYPIAGLITLYGGVASHMAIRAAEFGLPAAIGCGKIIFDYVKNSNAVELNCANRQIRRIQ